MSAAGGKSSIVNVTAIPFMEFLVKQTNWGRCCGKVKYTVTGVSASNIIVLVGIQLLFSSPASHSCVWEAQDDGLRAFIPATEVGDPNEMSGSWSQPGLALAVEGIWGGKQ